MMKFFAQFLLFAYLCFTAQSAGPITTDILLLLSDDIVCIGCVNTIFSYPITVNDNSSLSLTLNITDQAANILYYSVPYDDESVSMLNDGLTAKPTPATPNTFLITHAAKGLVQYNTVIVNASSQSSSLYIGDMKPDVSAVLPGIGNYPLMMKYLFHIDVVQSYFGVSYVSVESPSTSDLHIYFWKDQNLYSDKPEPYYTWQRQVPYCSGEFGLVGGEAAVNHQEGLVYLSVAFWQSCDPKYDGGWLLTYNAVNNTMAAPILYPRNVSSYLDYSVDFTYSAARKSLYSAIFYNDYTVIVEVVNPIDGSSKRIIDSSSSGTQMDLYDVKHVFEETTGNWFFLTVNEYISVDEGLPWILFSINVDTAKIGPINNLLLPYDAIAITLNSHTAAVNMEKQNKQFNLKEKAEQIREAREKRKNQQKKIKNFRSEQQTNKNSIRK